MMTPGELLGTWIGAGLTLIMFSFIYKDNPLFKVGEHLYLGISVGYYINITYWNVIIPDVYRKMTVDHLYWVIIPAILGLFIILRLVPSLSWLSRMAFAFYIGGAAGVAIPQVLHELFLPQLSETLRPFTGTTLPVLLAVALVLVFCWLLSTAMERGNWIKWSALVAVLALIVTSVFQGWAQQGDYEQLIILVGVFTVLIFFFFSLEHKKLVGSVSRIGLFFIMVGFGAAFGYTVMARISLLIGRFQFLIYDWVLHAIMGKPV
jgi:hypothetical protein